MSQNEAVGDYIFKATNKATDVSLINISLKVPPFRNASTNLTENKENVYEEIIDYASKNYDTPIAPSSKKYDYLDFANHNGTANKKVQIKPSFIKNRKKLIIFSSILFVIAIVAIIAVIMIVLATASKNI
jgi:hypothetical protein